MEYAELVAVYDRLEATSATLEKTGILAETFEAADADHVSMLVKLVRGRVFANWKSKELGVSTALASDAIEKATGVPGGDIEAWWREEGDLGDAAAKAVASKSQQTLFTERLTVRQVHDTLRELAEYEGSGSEQRRVDAIAGLLSSAEPGEARYIVRTVVGAMRLGVGEGLIRDAIAWAFLEDTDEASRAVERAYEVTNDFPLVALRAKRGGREALAELDVAVFRPIKPMLAQKAESMAEAVAELADEAGAVRLETKYDGIRAKLHGDGTDVRLFTRRLEEVTDQFPDVVEAVSDAVGAEQFILEAEIVGYDPDTGDVVPFQELSKRIKRKYDIEELVADIPVTVHVFDCLLLDGDSLLERSLSARLDRLEAVFSAAPDRIERAAHLLTSDVDAAESFYDDAVAAGHEGVMVKNPEAPYRPGSRVGYQLKVKSTMEPLDLVVTRAKWSEGRKSDFLGRPYLACRDESDGSLREVGRMHTGFTDAQLEEFTATVESLIQDIDGREAILKPEVVLEVEYEEIQESPKYDSGYALRFPRLSRIRSDLGPDDADTFGRVESLYEQQG
jgi:DNA ligase-1